MSKHIQFSRQLNLNRFLFSPPAGINSCYKFVSLINHMGPSQHCGHYTAIAEASNGQLYLFDDCSVRLISLNVALSTGAYVLIYEKVHQPASPSSISKLNGQNSTPAVKSMTPAKMMIPRPALISDSRPKINFALKKQETAGQPSKPMLVVRNGGSLFNKSIPLNGGTPAAAVASKVVNGCATASATAEARVTSPVSNPTPSLNAAKMPTALVPYESESEDDLPTSQTHSTGQTPAALLKATENKWQVNPSPTPSDSANATILNSTSTKWLVSDSSQQDNSSSSSSTGNNSSTGNGKWVVRSLSDTETERARSQYHNNNQEVYHSDTESRTGVPPSFKKTNNKTGGLSGSGENRVGLVTNAAAAKPETSDTTSATNGASCCAEPDTRLIADTVDCQSNPLPNDDPSPEKAKCNAPKWDGNRMNDTVKELLKMSHSGYDDQGNNFSSRCRFCYWNQF